MKRLIFLLIFCTSCVRAPDNSYPVMQTQIAGHTLSCKGDWCCYPWDKAVSVCVKVEGTPIIGTSGVQVFVRGRFP